MARNQWRDINGVLLLDKAVGISSNDALQQARRLYQARKAGHAGTLDPLASGLLLCAFGQATKFIHELIDADKTYVARVKLGWSSSTGDGEGELTVNDPDNVLARLGSDDISAAVRSLTGNIVQQPPMHSAIKHKGKPLYVYARRGLQVEPEPRNVVIHELAARDVLLPELTLTVRCSKGTYIRTLAEDFGRALGCGAYLTGLRRERVADFSLAQANTIESLGASRTNDDPLDQPLLPMDCLVHKLPAVFVSELEASRFEHGQSVPLCESPPDVPSDGNSRCRVYQNKRFLGVGQFDDGLVAPKRLIVQPN